MLRRTLAMVVERGALPVEAAHAADASWLACASRSSPLLRIYGFSGDVLSLGRYHRRPAGAGGIALHRRRSGGRVAASGWGFVHVALYLPHRAALVAEDPAALAPEQIVNRCVRGLLGGLEALGVDARYPGRDLVTARGRPIAVLGLEVADDGATLVDAVVAVGRDQSILPFLLDCADPSGVVAAPFVTPADVTSVERETGRTPAIDAVAAAIASGMERRLGLRCTEVTAPRAGAMDGPVFDQQGWLDSRRVVPTHPHRARCPTMLGSLEIDLALAADGTVAGAQVVGDFFAPSAAIARLEQSLVGTPLAWERVHTVVAEAFAPPRFLLGVGSPRDIAAAIVATARQAAAAEPKSPGSGHDRVRGEGEVTEPEHEALEAMARRAAWDAQALGQLVAALESPARMRQRHAAELLARLAADRRDVVALLEDALAVGSARQRWGAAYALARCGRLPSSALPVLLEVMGDADGDSRWAAAALIVRALPAPTVLPALQRVLAGGTPTQRKMALYCLRDIAVRDEEIADAVAQACTDPVAGVRLAAMAALTVVTPAPRAAAQVLLRSLHDPDAGVRRAAAAHLGRLGIAEPSVRAGLAAIAQEHEDATLRRLATRTLARLGSEAR